MATAKTMATPGLPLAKPAGIYLPPHPIFSQHPYPLIGFVCNILLQLLVFTFPPFRHRSAIFAPLIILTAILSHMGPITSSPQSIYGFGTHWPTYISTLDLLLFAPLPLEYTMWRTSITPTTSGKSSGGDKHLKQKGDKPGEAATWAFSFKKFRWSLSLFLSPRGIGWNWRVKNALPYPEKHRGEGKVRFILRRLCWQLIVLFLYDFAHTIVVSRYHLGGGVYVSTRYGGYGPYGLLRKAAIAYVSFAGIECTHINASIIAVGLGMSEPEDWPPLFGHFRDLTTVQNFWGKVWHQLLRRTLTAYSNAPFSSTPSHYRIPMHSHLFRLLIAFSISGLGHAIPLRVMPNNAYILPTGIIKFYLAQACIIFLESIVIQSYRNITGDCSKSWKKRIVGHVWVGAWFAVVAPWFWDDMFICGMMDGNTVPVNIAGMVLGVGKSLS